MKILNEVLADSNSKIITSVINSGGVIAGELFAGKKDYFLSDIENTKKIASKVEKETGMKGFITTGELPKYGITSSERDAILESMGAGEDDTVAIVAGDEKKAEVALKIIKENAQ